jgi:hypothetical protein
MIKVSYKTENCLTQKDDVKRWFNDIIDIIDIIYVRRKILSL